MRTQLQGAQHLHQQQVSPVMLLRRPAAIRTCRAAGQRVVQPHIALSRQICTLATPDGGTGDASSSPPQHEAPATPAATTADSAAAAPAPAPAPEAASTSARQGDVSLLTTAEPIDRLRYQAVLVFDYFDTAKAGRLTAEQVQAFFTWSSRKVSWSPGLSDVLQQEEAKFSQLKQAGSSREEFIKLVRSQVHAVSTSQAFQSGMLRPDVTARLQAQMSVNVQELAAAKWVFGLLDFDNDGKVSLAMYSKAEGIEAYVYEDKIEDADADDDGQITFEEFLVSYARPKPILKNLLIMVINTAVIYFILQAPVLDVMLKVVLVGVLMLRPQIVSKPAALLHDAIKAIVDQSKAQAEVAKSNRGVWRPA